MSGLKRTPVTFAALAGLAVGISCAAAAIEWPQSQVLPTFAPPRSLDVVDLLHAPGEHRLLLAGLQGIVNRTEPRIYLLEPADEGPETWLRELTVPQRRVADPLDLVRKYRAEIKGVVIYDPEFPDSVNLATTLAGLEDALVASPQLADVLREAPYGLPVIEDFRGRFQTRLEAYTWQFETLWPRCDPRLLVGLPPGRGSRSPRILPDGFRVVAEETTRERGATNREVREIDISPHLDGKWLYLRIEDAFPEDGWGGALGRLKLTADGRTLAAFNAGGDGELPFLHDAQRSQSARASGGFRFADNDRSFTYRFEIPPGTTTLRASLELWNQFRVSVGTREPRLPWTPFGHLRDYAVANRAMVIWLDANAPAECALFEKILAAAKPGAPYLGWFGNDIEGEFSAVETTSRHGIPVVPADWFNNLTVFSGRTPLAAPPAAPPAPPLENRIHLTLTFGEGDNLQYNQHRMRRLWDDPARGKVPINWSASPLLVDAAPAILSHYRRTATPNDLLVMGPSGVGYFYPVAWEPAALDRFLAATASYAERSGMTIPYVLNRLDHRDVPLQPRIVEGYRKHLGMPGILLGWGARPGLTTIAGVSVSEIQGIGTLEEGRRAAAALLRQWDGKSPAFASLGLFAWRLTPTDVAAFAASLGPEFRIVRADHYFPLIRQSSARAE